MSKLILTNMDYEGTGYRVCAVAEQNRIMEVRLEKQSGRTILGNIYVGVVENINTNIQAAFVRIQDDIRGYFPLAESGQLIHVNPVKKERPLQTGDEILVQVSREAMKGKLPALTANLNFTGKYLVLTTGEKKFGLSKKLSSEDRSRISGWFQEEIQKPDKEYGIVIRTNAGEAEKRELLYEYEYLQKTYEKAVVYGKMRCIGSCVYQPEAFYINRIRDMVSSDIEEIITDLPEVREEVASYLREFSSEHQDKFRFYEDKLLPLYKLYRLESALDEICQKKVWLKSGGFLVIEQTEAFVSIDVNTGKYTDRKKAEETYRKINLEAAGEIARQLRLRNLSGIILIDFINMENPDHNEELFHVLKKLVKKDTVKSSVIDITPLNILEMTRKKVHRPVVEELKKTEA